jgi:hypothetical protein
MKYNCNINGKNFLLKFNGVTSKHGFYKWITVEAENKEDAELQSIELIKEDEKITKITKNSSQDSPTLHLEEIKISEEDMNNSGYTFYSENNHE